MNEATEDKRKRDIGLVNWHVEWIPRDMVRLGKECEVVDYALHLEPFADLSKAKKFAKQLDYHPHKLVVIYKVVGEWCDDIQRVVFNRVEKWKCIMEDTSGRFDLPLLVRHK